MRQTMTNSRVVFMSFLPFENAAFRRAVTAEICATSIDVKLLVILFRAFKLRHNPRRIDDGPFDVHDNLSAMGGNQ
jgi:hypothetical protein